MSELPEPRSYGQGTSGVDFMRPFYWADEVTARIAELEAENERLNVNNSAQTDRLVKLESRLAEAASLFRRMWSNDQALGYESYCRVFMTAAHELMESWAERGDDSGYLKRSHRDGLTSVEVSFPAKYSNRSGIIARAEEGGGA